MAENESKNVTGAGLKAALEAVRAKVPTAGETQRRFGSVTAENWPEIRVGDVVLNGTVSCFVVSKTSTEIQAIISRHVNFGYALRKYTLSGGTVTTSTPAEFISTIKVDKIGYSDMPTSLDYLPTGSRFGVAKTSDEKTVLSSTPDGKKMQVLEGTTLHRYTKGTDGTITGEDYEIPKKGVVGGLEEAVEGLKPRHFEAVTDENIAEVRVGDTIGGVEADNGSYYGAETVTDLGPMGVVTTSMGTTRYRFGTDLSDVIARQPTTFGSVTAENWSEIRVGDTVQGVTVCHKGTNDLTVLGGNDIFGIWATGYRLYNGTVSSRSYLCAIDYEEILKPTAQSEGTLKMGSKGLMPIAYVYDERAQSYGLRYGMDSATGNDFDVLMGNTVTRYRIGPDNENGGKLKEWEIPEKGKVEEIEARLPKEWPTITAANFAQIKAGDRLTSSHEIVLEKGSSMIVTTDGNTTIAHTLEGGSVFRRPINILALLSSGFNWVGQDLNREKFYKLTPGERINYELITGGSNGPSYVLYNTGIDYTGDSMLAIGGGNVLEGVRLDDGTYEKRVYRTPRVWYDLSSYTKLQKANWKKFCIGDIILGRGVVSQLGSDGKTLILFNDLSLACEQIGKNADGSMVVYRMKAQCTTSEETYPAPSSDPEAGEEPGEG